MSVETWKRPSSLSTSFSAEKNGRSGQPMQKPGGRAGAGPPSAANAFAYYGIVTTAMQPKPAYTAITSIIGQLADPSTAFAPAPLT